MQELIRDAVGRYLDAHESGLAVERPLILTIAKGLDNYGWMDGWMGGYSLLE